MSATALVEIGAPGDRAFELAKFVAQVAYGGGNEDARRGFMQRCRDAVTAADFETFLGVVLDNGDAILNNADADDVQGAFILMYSFLPSFESAKRETLRERIVQVIRQSTDKASLRLRLLADMYNVLDSNTESSYKLQVFFVIVDYAAKVNMLQVLEPYLLNCDEWVTSWGLSLDQQRQLFSKLSEHLEKAGKADDAQAFLIRYLVTFEDEDAVPESDLQAGREHAHRAAIGYIKAPVVSQKSNLPTLRAVQALKNGSGDDAQVFELLSIFAAGDIDDYVKFHAAHASFISKLGLRHEESLQTMRLLSLCSLTSAQRSLSFEDLASTAKVPVDEVEDLIVQAVSRGIMDAKIDSFERTVHVSRAIRRQFTDEQWSLLQSQLHAWRDSVTQLASGLRSSRDALA